jgi:hypothetical protein
MSAAASTLAPLDAVPAELLDAVPPPLPPLEQAAMPSTRPRPATALHTRLVIAIGVS